MNNRFKFTVTRLKEIEYPLKGHKRYYDSKFSGLCLKVTPQPKRENISAKKFYVYRSFDGRPKEIKIGAFPEWPIDKARKKARVIVGQLEEGTFNPIGGRAKGKTITLEEALDTFIERKRLKPRTVETYQQSIHKHLKDWLKLDLTEITFDRVQKRYSTIQGDAVANNAMKPLSAIWKFTQATLLDSRQQPVITQANPVELLKRSGQWREVGKKTDYLLPYQIKKWYKAIQKVKSIRSRNNDEVIRNFFMFLLLTGIRKQDGMTLHHKNVDMRGKVFTLVDTKSSRTNEKIQLPLNQYHMKYLKNKSQRYVFPSCDGPHIRKVDDRVREVRDELGFYWSLHSLRRTFETTANNLEIPVFNQKRLMTHSQTDITEAYAQLSMDRLRKDSAKICKTILQQAGVI